MASEQKSQIDLTEVPEIRAADVQKNLDNIDKGTLCESFVQPLYERIQSMDSGRTRKAKCRTHERGTIRIIAKGFNRPKNASKFVG